MADGSNVRVAPGSVRDAIFSAFAEMGPELSLPTIEYLVRGFLGADVSASSIRSFLNNNTPGLFERTGRGVYILIGEEAPERIPPASFAEIVIGKARLVHADCLEWLDAQDSRSIHAVVTDPPYGLVEYEPAQLEKKRSGRGGVWRIPPSFDGVARAPLPRFTVLGSAEVKALSDFFLKFGKKLLPRMRPGGNVLIASNPLLFHHVIAAMEAAGFEHRGVIVRLVMTMRGGDRPKNAHEEFRDVSVMARSMWEPWVMLRSPLEGRVQDNLRTWKTGGFRRISDEQPFGDVIRSAPTNSKEKALASHPSLKPQEFLRKIVRAALPLGEGVILDPFAGGGSTLAAANALGIESIGVERNSDYVSLAIDGIPKLATIQPRS